MRDPSQRTSEDFAAPLGVSGSQRASCTIPLAGDRYLHAFAWRDSGHPVLMLHGFGVHAAVWRLLALSLDAGYRPIAVDLRGHGDSSWHDRYQSSDFLADLEHVAEWIGRPFTLIGHSLGGEIAGHLAAQAPDKVRALALVDVGAHSNPRGRERIRADLAAAAGDYACTTDYWRELQDAYPLAEPVALRSIVDHALRKQASGRYSLKLDPALRRPCSPSPLLSPAHALPDFFDALTNAPMPSLVVRGALSGILRRPTALRTVESLPRGRLLEIPRAGHAVMLDNPRAFARGISAFLREAVGG